MKVLLNVGSIIVLTLSLSACSTTNQKFTKTKKKAKKSTTTSLKTTKWNEFESRSDRKNI
ncbi:MAG: hypothetical protein HOE90_14365 [Bacteriovoracaceae bacterium]|nr:hypothetical protein [Bacteriovoracaceae bacterium]